MIVPLEEIPERVPFMLLPNAVLLPNTVLPLFIFEKKYRLMLADCLAGERMFGVALCSNTSEVSSEDDVARLVGVGLIRACLTGPDGTSTLVLHGLGRFRVIKWEHDRPYWVGQIDLVRDTCDEATCDLERKVLERCSLAGAMAKDILPILRGYNPGKSDPGLLADVVAGAVLDSCEEKQALLEEASVSKRLAMLLDRM